MMLIEETTVPQAALPLDIFKSHMRLGTGFGEDTLQDALLEQILRSAIAAIEARTGKVLLERLLSWTLTAWRDSQRQPLPVAPVSEVLSVIQVDRLGTETPTDPTGWALAPDTHRPHIVTMGSCLPTVPQGGSVRVRMQAGYGPAWTDLPPDLAQAVLMLATHFYEHRADTGDVTGEMPFGVSSLIAPFRNVRLFMGGGRS